MHKIFVTDKTEANTGDNYPIHQRYLRPVFLLNSAHLKQIQHGI